MCHVIYTPVDESSLRESVTARIDDMNQDEFLDYHTFRRFITAISLLDRWYPKDVHVFSVHSEGRLTNVTFFVRHKGRLQRYAISPMMLPCCSFTVLGAHFRKKAFHRFVAEVNCDECERTVESGNAHL